MGKYCAEKYQLDLTEVPNGFSDKPLFKWVTSNPLDNANLVQALDIFPVPPMNKIFILLF